MSLPVFYHSDLDSSQKKITLDEENSKHVVQVLRMKVGEQLNLTDGKGNLFTAEIVDAHKKHCDLRVLDSRFTPHDSRKITLAISLLKNSSRFEWFLEKATEIGVTEIVPMICDRTEKQKFREDRLQNILVSAMLQSQQTWLPVLHKPIDFELLFRQQDVIAASQKFIAHCIKDQKRNLGDLVNEALPSQVILIGPEGDFTLEEVELAKQNHFMSVSLGNTRLRAETAGVVAATILKIS
jgi:16S rRNA (uracil1498-N3)-methyltransferase